jgi:hypothetical protein
MKNKLFQNTFKGRRRVFIFALSAILVLASATVAFAAWPSFQSNNFNNGVITTAPPTSSSTTATPVSLGTSGTAYSGVDATPVINGDYSYTLYNGGDVNGTSGGARLAKTNLANKTSADYQVDPSADNVQQLSTPYLDTANNKLYTATTYYVNQLQGSGVAGWTDSGGTQITSPYIFPVNTSTGTTIIYEGLTVPSDYWEPQLATNIDDMGTINASAVVQLVNPSTGAVLYTFPTSTYYPGYGDWIIYNSGNANILPAGTYDLKLTIKTDTALDVSSFKFLVSKWRLWEIDVSGATPVIGTPEASGYGQANTPIGYSPTYNNIYFGIYEGDRSYYNYLPSSETLTRFNAQDDFYWAGALPSTVNFHSRPIFGSDSGKLYVQDNADFSAQATVIDLTDTQTAYGRADAGRIRSTIVNGSIGYIYFTSTGTGTQGYLWKIQLSTIASANPNITSTPLFIANADISTTSTPVLSTNGILYVGLRAYQTASPYAPLGEVQAFDALSSPPAKLNTIYPTSGTGDPVSASPIVWSDTDGTTYKDDFVYFTTNSGSGAGYCYLLSEDIVTGVITTSQEWTAPNTSGNKYSLQGMASDNNRVVWGDDGNNLYIAP